MTRRPASLLNRATALLAALCVLVLTVLAVSPELHAGLHAESDAAHADCAHHDADVPVGEAGHTCVVTFFSHGAMALLVFCLLLLARPAVTGLNLRATDELVVPQPRYRLVPSHAPPAA
jgi:hypothetical protein